jgi:hypothetical protein
MIQYAVPAIGAESGIRHPINTGDHTSGALFSGVPMQRFYSGGGREGKGVPRGMGQ